MTVVQSDQQQEGKETARPARSVRRTATATSDRPASKYAAPRAPVQQDLHAWAAELVAALPPMTESAVAAVARLAARLAAVARLAARLDAAISKKPTA